MQVVIKEVQEVKALSLLSNCVNLLLIWAILCVNRRRMEPCLRHHLFTSLTSQMKEKGLSLLFLFTVSLLLFSHFLLLYYVTDVFFLSKFYFIYFFRERKRFKKEDL